MKHGSPRPTARTSAVLDATTRWMSWLAADWDRRLAAVKRAAETAEHDST